MKPAPRHLRPLALWVVALLAGCSGGLKSSAPTTQTYVIRAPASAGPGAPLRGASIQVSRPLPSPGLAGDAIVVLQPGNRLDTYAGSRWPAPLPDVVEGLVVETLRARGEFVPVVDSRSAFPAEWLLQVRIRRFEAEYAGEGAPTVHVSLDCTLGRRLDREVVASFVAEGTARAGDNRLGAVVVAFEQAAGTALTEMASRSAEAVRTSKAPSPP